MVRLTYTCPKCGLLILGTPMSETFIMQAYHSEALVKCPGCEEDHHPMVYECQMYRSNREPSTGRQHP
jgi:hypothetical protein